MLLLRILKYSNACYSILKYSTKDGTSSIPNIQLALASNFKLKLENLLCVGYMSNMRRIYSKPVINLCQ